MLRGKKLFSLTIAILLVFTLVTSASFGHEKQREASIGRGTSSAISGGEAAELLLSDLGVNSSTILSEESKAPNADAAALSVVQGVGTTTRVSVASDGTQANGRSDHEPSISADGRYVAFDSYANNLVQGDTNDDYDIFVHDSQSDQTTRVSVASDGTQGDGNSYRPSISADGRYVAFESYASNLVPGDTNGECDIFVHDRQTGETTRVSLSSSGVQGNDGSYALTSISADGRYVAFNSVATNLVPDDTNGVTDAFVHDRQGGETTRVSVASDGAQGDSYSYGRSISADGRYVAFYSLASNLVTSDTNGVWDVFVHDRETGETTRVSVASDGTQGDYGAGWPSISDDGRYVAFDSSASNLVSDDTNDRGDIFVRDRETAETTRVSVASDGTQATAGSRAPSISANGRYVAFKSNPGNLVPDDTNDAWDVFLHDRETGETTRVSVSSDSTQANNDSTEPSISGDGRYVAFRSVASNLVSGDTNGVWDAFVHDRGSGIVFSISGHIWDGDSNPLPDVTVSAGAGASDTTDATGVYTITGLIAGTYVLTAGKSGYEFSPAARVVRVPPDATSQDFTTTVVYGSLAGRITDQASGAAVAGARVNVAGQVVRSDANGDYTLNDLLPGLHNVYVSADGYKDYKGEAVIEAGTKLAKDVAVTPIHSSGYYLPYPDGSTYECIQGNGGTYSHQGDWYYAFDFGIPDGHQVVASRGGRVVAVKDDSNTGCDKPGCADQANYVRIRHKDGTATWYYHLKLRSAVVDQGDFVSRGDVIAESDTTGWCTGPHLDFTRHNWGQSGTIPVSFADVPGDGIPKAGEWYTSQNHLASQALSASAVILDTDPPLGNVQFRFTGRSIHTLVLGASDYITNVCDVRVAATEPDLQAASWLSFTTRTTWSDPAVFAQFRDANGNVSAVVSDTVDAIGYEPLQAAFTVSPTVCVGRGLPVTNRTTPFCEQCGWHWDFGNGTTSTRAEPGFGYMAMSSFSGYGSPGMYTVTLTATNAISSSTAAHQVQALSTPPAGFTVVQLGETITVEAEALDAAGWAWDFGDGTTATGRIATHTYSSTDTLVTYPIQLVVEGQQGCTSFSHQFVSLAPTAFTPPTTLDIEGPSVGLINEPYAFTATVNTTTTTPVTYTWNSEGHPTVTRTAGVTDTAVFSWTTSGRQSLVVTAANAGGIITATHNISLSRPLQADFEALPTAGLAPLTTVFTNTSSGDYTHSLWQFGDGVTSTRESPTHTYTDVGAYTVTLTISGTGGTSTETKPRCITVEAHRVYLPLTLRNR